MGGVPCVELNQLEVDFLFRVNFSLRVTPDDFFKYHAEVMGAKEKTQTPARACTNSHTRAHMHTYSW